MMKNILCFIFLLLFGHSINTYSAVVKLKQKTYEKLRDVAVQVLGVFPADAETYFIGVGEDTGALTVILEGIGKQVGYLPFSEQNKIKKIKPHVRLTYRRYLDEYLINNSQFKNKKFIFILLNKYSYHVPITYQEIGLYMKEKGLSNKVKFIILTAGDYKVEASDSAQLRSLYIDGKLHTLFIRGYFGKFGYFLPYIPFYDETKPRLNPEFHYLKKQIYDLMEKDSSKISEIKSRFNR